MPQNSNWPLMQVEWSPQGHVGYGSDWLSYEDMPWLDITENNIQQWTISRGRQYEINAVQAGSETTAWDNRLGYWDPSNTGSAYYPDVTPYRAYRRRAQWPPGSVNLLPVDQATSGEGSGWGPGASPTIFGLDTFAVLAEYQVVASPTAYQGTQVMEATLAADPATPLFFTRIPATAGAAYSYTIHLRCTTPGQNPPYFAGVVWSDPLGNTLSSVAGATATLTGGTAPAWTALTVSATAPAGTGYATIGAFNAAAISTLTQIQGDGLQWEANFAPSPFSVPAPWYQLFTGGVERYPQSWTMSGTFGLNAPTITDAFALLSQSLLIDPLTNALFTPAGGSAPAFAYLLGDSSSSGTCADTTGNRQAAQIEAAQAGPGTITLGTAQSAVTVPGGEFLGAPGATVANIASTGPPGSTVYGYPMSWIALPANGAGVVGPGNGTGLGFTRMIAFRCTSAPAAVSTVWTAQNGTNVNEISIQLYPGGDFVTTVVDATHTGAAVIGSYDIGNWHLGWIAVAPDGSSATAGIDGTVTTFAATGDYAFSGGFSLDQIGCSPINGAPFIGYLNFDGDVAFAVEWPFVLSSDQVAAVYGAWRSAFSGDSSGQRYARILGWAGWTGPTAIDTGSSLSLGPATDIVGLDALSALQAVVDTEAGNHYVDTSGRLTFKARAARYNSTSPTYIFGEGPPVGNAGEWPYEDVSFDCDPTLLCNLAQITQATTSQVLTASNATSQSNFGTRVRQITNQSTSAQECQDQATYVVSRYQQPTQRIASLKLHPSAIPGMWPVALGMELGARIRVIRRPPAAPAITTDCFVENIAWSGTDQAEAFLTLQCSPVDTTPYAVYAALHTTLHAQASSGQAAVVLNPLPDAATNSFSCYAFSGMQVTLDPGTALSETLTVLSVSATSPGYSTVTITFSANLANTHAAAAMACEALPALSSTTYTNGGSSYTPPGPTSPTMWDSTMFDSSAWAY